jgi:D-alanine-D-alanine ligase
VPAVRVTLILDDDQASPPSLPGTEARVDVLRVADAVKGALLAAGHEVRVRAIGADLAAAVAAVQADAPDAVFNLCESLAGDARGEAVVAGVLEQLGLAVTGSPALALGLALHKDMAKALLRGSGVPTPEWCILYPGDRVAGVDPGDRVAGVDPGDRVAGVGPGEHEAGPVCGAPAFPVIVKPAREDGSIGIGFGSVATDDAGLREAIHRVWRMGQPALVERFVDGRELCVSFLGNAPRTVLPLREISFGPSFAGRPRIVSYQAKWDPAAPEFGDTCSGACQLPPGTEARVIACARDAFEALGCRDYGRVDVRLDGDGTPYVIDINPNCDLHPEAGFARAANAVGIGYAALIASLLENALARAPHHEAHRAPGRRGAGAGAPPDQELHRG